jgi:hypothetical protein
LLGEAAYEGGGPYVGLSTGAHCGILRFG